MHTPDYSTCLTRKGNMALYITSGSEAQSSSTSVAQNFATPKAQMDMTGKSRYLFYVYFLCSETDTFSDWDIAAATHKHVRVGDFIDCWNVPLRHCWMRLILRCMMHELLSLVCVGTRSMLRCALHLPRCRWDFLCCFSDILIEWRSSWSVSQWWLVIRHIICT